MVDRYDWADYVREFLTDYNDNFIGEPCTEIVDEVLGYLELHEGITDDQIIDAIDTICYEMFG